MKTKILAMLGLLIILAPVSALDYDLPEENRLTTQHINIDTDRYTSLFIEYPYSELSWRLFYPELHKEICSEIGWLDKLIIRLRIGEFC